MDIETLTDELRAQAQAVGATLVDYHNEQKTTLVLNEAVVTLVDQGKEIKRLKGERSLAALHLATTTRELEALKSAIVAWQYTIPAYCDHEERKGIVRFRAELKGTHRPENVDWEPLTVWDIFQQESGR